MLNTYLAERIYREKLNGHAQASSHRRAIAEVIAEFKAARQHRDRKVRRS